MPLLSKFNNRFLGNVHDQNMIGTYFHRESPRISPKGVCTSCVAKQYCHACLQAFSSVALAVCVRL